MANPLDTMELVRKQRLAGRSWEDIAEEMYGDLGQGLEMSQRLQQEYAQYLERHYDQSSRQSKIAQEVARLDAMHAALWDKAMDGDVPAINSVLNISKQRAKITGIDLPDPTDKTVTAQVLVIGNDQAEFMAALKAGRESKQIEA